ncbi:hypothetical protein COT69_01395 [candidate division WWE3 bacterium CG09_land_8_20_14_0_10_39_24]|uniref:Uncharacterized protein n=2 Tax=Katanobacteria TaxID=422282 RepID=A0A2G9XD32_UNCKA|nr:MAG: hypothetical protein AUJ94_01105 [bacterium CG2_30_40_12]OJI09095.1 MAG: hypothetical protein BK003_01370 [bacterium CG09_39_24]PIP04393.1 MAG: hypothetical protein COX53_02735 [candidate division WWE3 bacterium CG23_combo_of_CG06-09_8_20_14_all_40_14]PIS12954.1 MAG: hypothetical protein COT69_01395 [candidate division WWE3 bacterium CG09_land_8_20_14_0_10_39_24]
MEKKVVLLTASLVVLLSSIVLFRKIAPKEKSPLVEDTPVVQESSSGYIKLPSGKRGLVTYAGKVVPSGASSYELLDKDGNLIVILTAEDAKLKLVEGRYAEVSGILERNISGETVLKVEALSFK